MEMSSMKSVAWLAPLLLVLGLACAGGGVDTGVPFEFTDDGAGDTLPKKPVGALPTTGGGRPAKPAPPPADPPTEAADPAQPDAEEPGLVEAEPPGDAADQDAVAEVEPDEAPEPDAEPEPGAADPVDADGDGRVARPGTPDPDATEPDAEPEPQDAPDADLPGQVLFLSAAGVTPYLNGRQMGFVAAEMGFLTRSIAPGRYEIQVRNLMGQTVANRTITVKSGQRTLVKYKRRNIEEAGFVPI